MRNISLYLLLPVILFSCKGEENDSATQPAENPVDAMNELVFSKFENKISYSIGFDSGFTISQVYNGPKTAGKFSLPDIESGMVDYLGDAELRISIFSVDSLLNLYLGEDGEVNEALVSKSDASYAIGLVEAQTLVGSMVGRGIDQQMEIPFLLDGISDGINNRETALSLNEARMEVSKYYSEMNQLMGESFLAQNAENEGVFVTESGLQYEIIEEGNGISPNLTDSCMVHYTGRFIDGRVFESTIPSNIPAEFTPMGVIRGWQEGLLMMKEGGSRRFFIPYELAYGETGSGPIEPYSALVFDIELLKVKRFNP